jgi:hypothetical protein
LGIVEMKKIGTGPIRPPVEGEDSAGTGGGLEDNRPRTVPKKNTGVAVSPVNNGGEAFCSDDQNISSRSRSKKLISHNKSVYKTGAGGLNIEGGAACRA